MIYIHLDSIDSTNNWAKLHAHEFDPGDITCITATEQTAGRGRFKRTWVSPRGENLYTSLYTTVAKSFPYSSNLSQIAALACVEALREMQVEIGIKWPNDLLLEGKKVGGILSELLHFEDYLGVVVGIGINVDIDPATLQTIDQPAVSLSQLYPKIWKAEQILNPVIEKFAFYLEKLKQEGFGPLHQLYNQYLTHLHQQIHCSHEGISLEGICHGVLEDGRLKLELPSGEIMLLHSGIIS